MAEINRAFELALRHRTLFDEAVADAAAAPVAHGEPLSFSVDVLPVEACEMLVVVCRILGEVLAVEEPYRIEAYVEVPSPCFCALDLVPEAGGTLVTVEVQPADADAGPSPEAVRDALMDELVRLSGPAVR